MHTVFINEADLSNQLVLMHIVAYLTVESSIKQCDYANLYEIGLLLFLVTNMYSVIRSHK